MISWRSMMGKTSCLLWSALLMVPRFPSSCSAAATFFICCLPPITADQMLASKYYMRVSQIKSMILHTFIQGCKAKILSFMLYFLPIKKMYMHCMHETASSAGAQDVDTQHYTSRPPDIVSHLTTHAVITYKKETV